MKQLLLVFAILASVFVLCPGSPAAAYDTSPFLFGTWQAYTDNSKGITETVSTNIAIVNPTSSRIDTCVCFYDNDFGNFISCSRNSISANGVNSVFDPPLAYTSGVFKVIATPYDKWAFDPNIVIGGFVTKTKAIGGTDIADPNLKAYTETESNLGAVVINSKTLPEYNRVMQDCRSEFE